MDTYRPRYNLPPGSQHPVVTHDAAETLRPLTWGFRAHWTSTGNDLINARSETVAEREAFADAWANRPCVIPSSGFYEWQDRRDGPNQPYRIYRPNDPAFALAGIWQPQEETDRFTILTTDANEDLAGIHDRMPVVLRREDEHTWVHGTPDERNQLCRPYPDEDLAVTPISRRVNNPAYDDRSIISPIEDPQTGLEEFG